MRVLVTVPNGSLGKPWGLRVMDGSVLSSHLYFARGLYQLPGISSTQRQQGARCAAEVLLQVTRRLVEVRAVAQGQHGATELAGIWGCCALSDRQLLEACIAKFVVSHCIAAYAA